MKPLIETNPYLLNKEHREIANAQSARTSCGVEGISLKPSKIKMIIEPSKSRQTFNKIKTRLNRTQY